MQERKVQQFLDKKFAKIRRNMKDKARIVQAVFSAGGIWIWQYWGDLLNIWWNILLPASLSPRQLKYRNNSLIPNWLPTIPKVFITIIMMLAMLILEIFFILGDILGPGEWVWGKQVKSGGSAIVSFPGNCLPPNLMVTYCFKRNFM